jgi:DNA-binding GntR family transcriptional regulator
MHKLFLTLSIAVITVVTSSCGSSSNVKNNLEVQAEKLLSQKHSPIVFQAEATPVIVTIKSVKDKKLSKKVNIASTQPLNIIAAINYADSELSVYPDSGVDIDKELFVKFHNQTLEKYFNYLENLTGYQIELIDSVVYVSSKQSKTWHLQSLSKNVGSLGNSASSEVESDGNAPTVVSANDGENWDKNS